jgi:hypothetical protein
LNFSDVDRLCKLGINKQKIFLSETTGPIATKLWWNGPWVARLVEIGLVVSEEKIFFKFHPPFFLFLTWRPFWLEVGITGHNFGRGPPKDHSTKVWLQLAQWFLTRRFFAYLCLICIIGRHRKSKMAATAERNLT